MKKNEIKLIHPEYTYELPPVPQKETDIMFYDRKKADQHWHRPRVPTDASWNDMSMQQRFILVERERERHRNGVWFMNNGEPTYITGMHYDHMVYQTFDYKPKFLISQQHDFYFRDLLWKDKKTYGGLVIKPRRYGYTDGEVTAHQYRATEDFFRYTGMMSDTRTKVYSTIYDKITASHVRRPLYMRANVYMKSGVVPKSKFTYSAHAPLKKESTSINLDVSNSLNSKIVPKATTVMGFDGDKLHYLTLDEIWKWVKVDPDLCWQKQKKTLFDGGNVIGKAMLLSTMGDDETYERAIKAGIAMWPRSDSNKRDGNGFTDTGLYRYFVPGYYALHSSELGYVNKFGEMDIDRATEYIMNERSKYEVGSLEHTYEMRRYPLTEDEAIGSALMEGVFDKKRIVSRITIIKSMDAKPYVEGNFVEDNNGKVHFDRNTNDPWLIAKHPLISIEKGIDKSNRWNKYDNRFIAPVNPEGAIGYDPIRYAQIDVVSDSLSKAAITAKYKFDYYRSGSESAAGHRAALYLNRPDNPDDAHAQCVMAAKYFGFKIMYERQVEAFLKYCREIQFTDFLLLGDDGKFGVWTDNQRKVINNGVDSIRQQWAPPKEAFHFDMLSTEPFIPMLEQGRDFDPKKTTKFDAIMCEIMCNKGLTRIFESTASDIDNYAEKIAALQAAMFPNRNGVKKLIYNR